MAEKVPGWVERLLIPTLETRVRAIVKEEVGHLEKTMNARFEAIDSRFLAVDSKFQAFDSKFQAFDSKLEAMDAKLTGRLDGISARIDSLEGRIPILQDIADLRARLAVVEKRTSG